MRTSAVTFFTLAVCAFSNAMPIVGQNAASTITTPNHEIEARGLGQLASTFKSAFSWFATKGEVPRFKYDGTAMYNGQPTSFKAGDKVPKDFRAPNTFKKAGDWVRRLDD